MSQGVYSIKSYFSASMEFGLFYKILCNPSLFSQLFSSDELADPFLYFALCCDAVEILRALLDRRLIQDGFFMIFGESVKCDSLLGCAVAFKAPDVVTFLLSMGVSPNGTIDSEQEGNLNLLEYAIIHADVTIAKKLLDAKCSIDFVFDMANFPYDWYSEVNPAHRKIQIICFAIANGVSEIIPDLIKAGCDVNAVSGCGHAALHYAIMFKSQVTDISITIKTLVDAGAYVDAQSTDGTTPLDIAYGSSYDDCKRALYEAGADPFRYGRCTLAREAALAWNPEVQRLCIHPRITDAAVVLLLCKGEVDGAHPFCGFPPEMLVQLLHELSCLLLEPQRWCRL